MAHFKGYGQGDRNIFPLEEIFLLSRNSVEGVCAERFRADYPEDLGALDQLTSKLLLTDRWHGKKLYRPTLFALPLLEHTRSAEILGNANAIHKYLRSRYLKDLGETIPLSEIATQLSKDDIDITEAFLYMRDGSGWFCGCSDTFPFGEGATIVTCENLLQFKSLDEIISIRNQNYGIEEFAMHTRKSIWPFFWEAVSIKPGLFGIGIDMKEFLSNLFRKEK